MDDLRSLGGDPFDAYFDNNSNNRGGYKNAKNAADRAGQSRGSPATTYSFSAGSASHDLVSPLTPPVPTREMFPPTGSNANLEPLQTTDEWWKGADEKKPLPAQHTASTTGTWATSVARNDTGATVASSSSRPQPHSEKARVLEEENQALEMQILELPPPYAEKDAHGPGFVPENSTPALTQTTTGQTARTVDTNPTGQTLRTVNTHATGRTGARAPASLADVPLTPEPAVVHESRDVPLPDRHFGTFIPEEHDAPMQGHGFRQQAERRRRRHEKEDFVARRVGNIWRGRGIFSENSYFGRPGREGRKRRRWCLGICGAVIAAIILAVSLGVALTHHAVTSVPVGTVVGVNGTNTSTPTPYSSWLNLTTFPAIPTGVLTVVGSENSLADSQCVTPSTLWSCDLPPDQVAQAAPFASNQPMFILQIQYDNSSSKAWNATAQLDFVGNTPDFPETSTDSGVNTTTSKPTSSDRSPPSKTGISFVIPRDRSPGLSSGLSKIWARLVGRTTNTVEGAVPTDPGFSPFPMPPTSNDLYFLGNTTDAVGSARPAGEPTPFFISILPSIEDAVGPNILNRRDIFGSLGTTLSGFGNGGNGSTGSNNDTEVPGFNLGGNLTATNLTAIVPPPETNTNGTGASARLLPHPYQQPLRLYDRGLSTERYAFYTYFNRSMYMADLHNANNADQHGGVSVDTAQYVVYYGFARYKVEIWTRKLEGNVQLLGNKTPVAVTSGNDTAQNVTMQPGSFPYPVTVTIDNHGGPSDKFAWWFNVSTGGAINTQGVGLVVMNYTSNGNVVNWNDYDGNGANASFLGHFGGTGGCKCAYQNWEQLANRQQATQGQQSASGHTFD